MRAINTGNTFRIYDDSMKVYEQLPAAVYSVRFSMESGFFLELHAPIEIKEDKIYGIHNEKIAKVMKSFDKFDRSLGVILSGKKGIGKSLFAKLLCKVATALSYPVIIVDKFTPGIANYIERIEQECVVLFDEFDKTFANIKVSENESNPQASLLSLFDGTAVGKKLYVVTCNDMYSLNDYLINRPGRFHYHFRFEYPNAFEIKEYLTDKLEEQYYDQIEAVVSFSRKVELNYDCLRAIAFELNCGTSFSEAIKDLNIINMRAQVYDIILTMEDGRTFHNDEVRFDMFDPSYTEECWMYDREDLAPFKISIKGADIVFNKETLQHYIPGDKIKITKYDADEYENGELEKLKITRPVELVFSRQKDKNIHYAV